MPTRIPKSKPRQFPKARAPIVRTEDLRERQAFYNSARWKRLRRAHLNENPLCERCEAEGRLVTAIIAHHKIDRLERPDLALDDANLESVCASHHSRHHNDQRKSK
jgi:5-methylcytosine-specific restriction protein A